MTALTYPVTPSSSSEEAWVIWGILKKKASGAAGKTQKGTRRGIDETQSGNAKIHKPMAFNHRGKALGSRLPHESEKVQARCSPDATQYDD